MASRDAAKHLDKDQRTATLLAEQAAWAASRRRQSVYAELCTTWISLISRRAA